MKVKIGLETHVQLATKTKLFCSCSIENLSEAEPNTRVCDICLGFPGSKPVLNKKAVDIGIKIALALNCKIHREFFFSRKSYFYPDMAKNFQISQ
ncbi:MAG TPA: Asp-tRNA(Asn)/Glu-tRNA(Gln) amidotransferase GatCAB subunit B, partial [Aquificae bacterium]|nr:Asp-tRNA(Asn)/Glu-tRNA(Gln) amidotransferase GatCAB subunit B [Aquificota bacterium]